MCTAGARCNMCRDARVCIGITMAFVSAPFAKILNMCWRQDGVLSCAQLQNPHLGPKLRGMGLTPETAFGCAAAFLFPPKSEIYRHAALILSYTPRRNLQRCDRPRFAWPALGPRWSSSATVVIACAM